MFIEGAAISPQLVFLRFESLLRDSPLQAQIWANSEIYIYRERLSAGKVGDSTVAHLDFLKHSQKLNLYIYKFISNFA